MKPRDPAGCIGKFRHPTRNAAQRAVKRALTKYTGCAPYLCRCCGGWHVGRQTHLPDARREERRV